MKRFLTIAVLTALLVLLMAACAGHERALAITMLWAVQTALALFDAC